MEPMDKEYLDQYAVSQRYRLGSLTPEESEAYEIYLLNNPDAVSQLELDTLLAKGLRQVATAPAAKASATRSHWWAVGAALLGGAAVAFSAVLLLLPTAANFNGQTQLVYLETVRGESLAETVRITADQVMVLVLDTGQNATTGFNAHIAAADQDIIKRWSDMTSDEFGQAVLLLETKQLHSGDHTLVIAPTAPASAALSYRIKLIR